MKGQFFLLGAIILIVMFFVGITFLNQDMISASENLKFYSENIKKDFPRSLNFGIASGLGASHLEDFTRFTKNEMANRLVDFSTIWIVAEDEYDKPLTALTVTVGNFLGAGKAVNVTISDGSEVASFIVIPGDGSGCTVSCPNGVCCAEAGERPWNCPGDCGLGYCGDQECIEEFGENCHTCAGDCGGCPICNDGTCGAGETCINCPGDCGSCPGQEFCGDGVAEWAEQCDDGNDVNGDGCNTLCKFEVCGSGICDFNESCVKCPGDCGQCEGGVCGNDVCEAGQELCSTCRADCGLCPPITISFQVDDNSTVTEQFFPVSNAYIVELRWDSHYRQFVWLREKVNMYSDFTLRKDDDIIRGEIIG